MNTILWRRINAEAAVPECKTSGAAGFDLSPIVDAVIPAGETVRLQTGLAVAIPVGFVGFIKPRSSSFYRGLDLDGTIDSDFRGPLQLQVRNTTKQDIAIKKHERIAQMVVSSIITFSVEVDSLDDTERGSGGFGSTG